VTYGFTEIDHLLTAAIEPQSAGEQYERLGFTVTPLSVIENLGVGNRLVLLRPLSPGTANFFECMGVVNRSCVPPMMASLLSGPPGVRSIVLSGPDARTSQAALARDGYPIAAPLDLKREWVLPDGEILTPSFLVTLPSQTPLPFNFCQYRTLHYYLRETWLVHSNSARHLRGVLAISDEPAELARYFEPIFASRASIQNGIYELGPGKVRLRIGDRAAMSGLVPQEWLPQHISGAHYFGFEIEVDSLSTVRALLAERCIGFKEHGGAIVVGPMHACGSALRFRHGPS